MTPRQNDSLSARLTRMNLLVSGAVLLIAGLAFFSYDLVSFRESLIRNLDVEAQVLKERPNAVTYVIRGDVTSAVNALPVMFKTDVEIDTGATTVRE